MKLHVNFNIGGMSANETIEGADAPEITRKAKMAIAGRLNFLVASFVRSMSDIQFAREVVCRYNSATGVSCVPPNTCDEFLQWAIAQDLASVLD
jgi:hypothetical protein